MRRRPAFTLVELLVVVGIVSVLVALLFPALSGARREAQRVHCQANLRTLGQAMTMYTQQYAVYPGCYASDPAIAHEGIPLCAVWPTRLRLYTGGNTAVFSCPAADERYEWRTTPNPGQRGAIAEADAYGYREGEAYLVPAFRPSSYGYNASGTHDRAGDQHGQGLGYVMRWDRQRSPYVRASQVKVASDMIAIGDVHSGTFVLHPGEAQDDVPGAIHKRGANILFCDGHVQWYPQRELTVTYPKASDTGRARRMWNRDNQP